MRYFDKFGANPEYRFPDKTSARNNSPTAGAFPRRRALTVLATMGLLSVSAPGMSATLQNAMNGMFTAVTNPSAYQSQDRMGLVGGSLTLRVPNNSINLMTFDPPRVDFGCGGIDLQGGSFSFLNKDRLVSILRNIGQSAVVALFSLAIKSISEPLDSVMARFSKVMQDVNSLAKNTCSIGSALAHPNGYAAGLSAESDQFKQVENDLGAATGKLTSTWDHFWSGQFDDTPGAQAKPNDSANPTGGNLMWRRLYQTKAYQQLGNAFGDETTAALMIMNITGTRIVKTDAATTADEAANTSTTCSPTSMTGCSSLDVHMEPFLTLEMLENPSSTDEIMGCPGADISTNEFDCQSPEQVSLSPLINGGTTVMAQMVLFGQIDASTPATADNPQGGIVYYILNNNSGGGGATSAPSWGNFDASSQLQFLGPALRQLVTVERDPAAVKSIASLYVKEISKQIAIAQMDALVSAARLALTGSETVMIPPDAKKNIDMFAKTVETMKANELPNLEAMNKLVAQTAATLGSGTMNVRQ